jgi:hypothetical protein
VAVKRPRAAELRAAPKKREPFPFVLDELASLDPWTRPMFGCLAVYVGERIVFILRDKAGDPDTGVWVSSEKDQQAALVRELPRLAPIDVFGDKVSGWKKLAASSPDFEEDVLAACELVRRGDPRIGKVPGAKKKKAAPKKHR